VSEVKNRLRPVVGIIMGSDSDLTVMAEAAKMLEKFGIPYEIEVTSAHRSPARTHEYATSARERGLKTIIVAAGGAAHLAGVVAALTILPIIAVPMATTVLSGIDSLLSSVQMPAGVPVHPWPLISRARRTQQSMRRKFWRHRMKASPRSSWHTRRNWRNPWRRRARASSSNMPTKRNSKRAHAIAIDVDDEAKGHRLPASRPVPAPKDRGPNQICRRRIRRPETISTPPAPWPA